ncbi:MAG: hypothetical protein JSS65_07430 [Armatimonadetes bacterium]|nr:hypothetical protein [Armatimonadota bacterium]
MLRKPLLGLLLTCCVGVASAAVEVITESKDGDHIRGDFSLRATVRSDNLVTKVELYVGEQLRDSKTSTPYVFALDTLAESEGPFTVKLVAYTSEGEKGTKTLTLNIDNELGKGLAYHIGKGNDALTVKNWGEAVMYGRTALKVKAKDASALLLLARANYGKGTYDLAEKFAQDVLEQDKSNIQALQMVSAVNLKKAFRGFTQSSPEEARAAIGEALKGAAKAGRAINEASVEKTPLRPAGGDVKGWADSLLRAGRYSLVADGLKDAFEQNVKDNVVASRLLFALIRSSRMTAAMEVVDKLKRRGAPDGYTSSLIAVAYQTVGDTMNSTAAEKQAMLGDPDNLGVQYASAYLAVLREKAANLGPILDSIEKVDPSGPIVNSYMSTRLYLLSDYSGSQQRFETAIMADPGNSDVLIEKGRQIVDGALSERPLASDATDEEKDHAKQLKADRLANALVYFEAAIEAKPDSAEALAGLALVHGMLGHADQTLAFGQAAANAAKTYQVGQLAYAVGLRGKGRIAESSKALEAAAKLDARVRGRTADATVVWRAYALYGRTMFVPAPGASR